MNSTSVKGDTIEARLRCMGASEVQKVQGVLYFVTFKLDSNEVSYTYNINAKNKYFLQRIRPYPIPEGIFSDEDQVVEFIKKDLKKFKNATLSSNFDQFLEVTTTISTTNKELETFFLNYNVDKACMEKLLTHLNAIKKTIADAKEGSDPIIL